MLKSILERTPEKAMIEILQNSDVEIVSVEIIGEDSIEGMSWNVYAVNIETREQRNGVPMDE